MSGLTRRSLSFKLGKATQLENWQKRARLWAATTAAVHTAMWVVGPLKLHDAGVRKVVQTMAVRIHLIVGPSIGTITSSLLVLQVEFRRISLHPICWATELHDARHLHLTLSLRLQINSRECRTARPVTAASGQWSYPRGVSGKEPGCPFARALQVRLPSVARAGSRRIEARSTLGVVEDV